MTSFALSSKSAAGFFSASEAIPANSGKAPEIAKGQFEFSLKGEKIANIVGKDVTLKSGTFEYADGVVVHGNVLEGYLKVNGTLIVFHTATITAKIRCKRLIVLGRIDSPIVIVDELAVLWSGACNTTKGLYVTNIQMTEEFMLSGNAKHRSEFQEG